MSKHSVELKPRRVAVKMALHVLEISFFNYKNWKLRGGREGRFVVREICLKEKNNYFLPRVLKSSNKHFSYKNGQSKDSLIQMLIQLWKQSFSGWLVSRVLFKLEDMPINWVFENTLVLFYIWCSVEFLP